MGGRATCLLGVTSCCAKLGPQLVLSLLPCVFRAWGVACAVASTLQRRPRATRHRQVGVRMVVVGNGRVVWIYWCEVWSGPEKASVCACMQPSLHLAPPFPSRITPIPFTWHPSCGTLHESFPWRTLPALSAQCKALSLLPSCLQQLAPCHPAHPANSITSVPPACHPQLTRLSTAWCLRRAGERTRSSGGWNTAR